MKVCQLKVTTMQFGNFLEKDYRFLIQEKMLSRETHTHCSVSLMKKKMNYLQKLREEEAMVECEGDLCLHTKTWVAPKKVLLSAR